MPWLHVVGDAVWLAALLSMSLLNLYCGRIISTEKVPMQWDFSGNPTWYADKNIGLWFPVAITLFIGVTILFKIRQAPTQPAMQDAIALILLGAICGSVHLWHILKVVEWSQKRL